MTPSQLQSALATSAALAEENVVYWVSVPVQPGETVMMYGFSPQPDAVEIAVERLADRDPGEPFGQPWQPPGDKSLPEPVEAAPDERDRPDVRAAQVRRTRRVLLRCAFHCCRPRASDASTCLRLGGRSATSSLPTPLFGK